MVRGRQKIADQKNIEEDESESELRMSQGRTLTIAKSATTSNKHCRVRQEEGTNNAQRNEQNRQAKEENIAGRGLSLESGHWTVWAVPDRSVPYVTTFVTRDSITRPDLSP